MIQGPRSAVLLLAGLCALTACPSEPPTPGTLVLASVPAGADVLIDGQPVGSTPYTLETPAAATADSRTLSLALSLAGHRTWRRTVVLHAHTSQTMNIFLQPRGGGGGDDEAFVVEELMLRVKVAEGWKVEVDGRAATASSSGHAALVAIGTHTIVISGAKGESHSYRVKVSEPGPAEIVLAEVGEEAEGNAATSALEYLGCDGCKDPSKRRSRPAAAKNGKSAAAQGDERAEVGSGPLTDVAVNTTPSAMVIVDGKKTERRTPIWPQKPLRLAAGQHELGFLTSSGELYLYRVEVSSKQKVNKLIIKKLGGRHSGNVRAEYVGRKR